MCVFYFSWIGCELLMLIYNIFENILKWYNSNVYNNKNFIVINVFLIFIDKIKDV